MEWSINTFGPERDGIGPAHHLSDEIEELLDSPKDISEAADCLLLIIDWCWREGYTLTELISQANNLQEIESDLIEEIEELLSDHKQFGVVARIFRLLVEHIRRYDYSYEQLIEATWKKHEINKSRDWEKPDNRGVSNHKKSNSNE